MSFKEKGKADLANVTLLNRADAEVLSTDEERDLLLELDASKSILLDAYRRVRGEIPGRNEDVSEIQEVVREMTSTQVGQVELFDSLRPMAIRYQETRDRLAMANIRLVAHVARKYRDRGLAPSDLLQDGFCGLLTSIDRFDPVNQTRLASYAVWWIRQAIQRAVAAGAYPVRLNPRHLQKLAQHGPSSSEDSPLKSPKTKPVGVTPGTIRQIHSATRPTISLNASMRNDEGASLQDVLSYNPYEETEVEELDEYVVSMIQKLKPREQVVIKLRYGLSGTECHSLSQVSEILDVSKERIRQIQESALAKLRSFAREKALMSVG